MLVHILFVINDHQHLFDHIGRCVHRSLVVTGNDNVQRFVVALHDLAIPSSPCSLFYRPSATDCNLASRLGLQFFLSLTTWSNDQSDKVVGRMLFDRNSNLLGSFAFEQIVLTGCWVHVHEFFEDIVSFRGVSLLPTNGPRVFAFSIRAVNCEMMIVKRERRNRKKANALVKHHK